MPTFDPALQLDCTSLCLALQAYAIGSQTIAQRLFTVHEDKIKITFITAAVGYGATVIGVGMLGVIALSLGVQPMDGDVNAWFRSWPPPG